MTILKKSALAALICTSALFTITPAQAQIRANQYYCHGQYGDNNDRGYWDWTFSADTEEDARAQAIKMYMEGLGEGGFVDVFECIRQ